MIHVDVNAKIFRAGQSSKPLLSMCSNLIKLMQIIYYKGLPSLQGNICDIWTNYNVLSHAKDYMLYMFIQVQNISV